MKPALRAAIETAVTAVALSVTAVTVGSSADSLSNLHNLDQHLQKWYHNLFEPGKVVTDAKVFYDSINSSFVNKVLLLLQKEKDLKEGDESGDIGNKDSSREGNTKT